MKKLELIQTAAGGGFPVGNQYGVFQHGDPIYIISKRQLISLLYQVRQGVLSYKNIDTRDRLLSQIDGILQDDGFVIRGSDDPAESLPDNPFRHWGKSNWGKTKTKTKTKPRKRK